MLRRTGGFDLVVSGNSSSDYFGHDAVGEDFNNDGYQDLVITAPHDSSAGTDAGAVYLFYGPFSGGSLSAADADLSLEGAAGDKVGAAVDAGDYDGDGVFDVATSAVAYDSNTGGVFIWLTESF